MAATDTIFALASGGGQAAVAVMRVSGALSGAVLRALCGTLPPARRASLRRLRDQAGALLDQAIVLWLPGPASYSGEDSAELHLHAGPAVLAGVAQALVAAGARPAEPGEFTRRAFVNGKMELTGAEAVADLIAAETEAQRVQALRQLDGALGRQFSAWAARLKHLLAAQEAMIDFPDEAGADEADENAGAELAALTGEIAAYLADERRGERLRDGLEFVLAGPPNVGKSSLINALTGKEVAIVAATPGTTRDVVSVRTVFGGVPVLLSDTAGLRAGGDAVEQEGMRRAQACAAAADVVVAVAEPGADAADPAETGAGRVLAVTNKIDLGPAAPHRLGVSVLTGAGLDTLRARLDELARALTQAAGPPPLTRARHRAACAAAVGHLRAAEAAAAAELRAEDLRLAMAALGRVTGHVGVEDLLDSVFSQFCIGK